MAAEGNDVQRTPITPREGWEKTVESQGLTYHTVDGHAYWDESAYYTLREPDAAVIEKATNELWSMCVRAVDHVLEHGLLGMIGVPEAYHGFVGESWKNKEPSLYGRFDLAYDGTRPPKLLEFNADTPTALVEASVAQWYWMKDVFPNLDQFNTIHEALVRRWRAIGSATPGTAHFSCMYDMDEDWMTINYLRDTALQAGIQSVPIAVEDIGWNEGRGRFVGEKEEPIGLMFKLYPWEWLMDEEFGPKLLRAPTRWVEPAWKTILSSKAILAVLWEMFPESPYLLRASLTPIDGDCVEKPLHSREGKNVRVLRSGRPVEETEGPYDGPVVYQQFCPLRAFDGRTPTVGSWVVGEKMCGVGIREDESIITRNTSPFVPHVYVA
jgi:glutathionylspermidine synthase